MGGEATVKGSRSLQETKSRRQSGKGEEGTEDRGEGGEEGRKSVTQ